MNKKVFFALAVLVLVAPACTSSPVTTVNTPPTQPPAVNTPNAQPTAGGGGNGLQILLQDDFSNVNSGWDRSTNDSYSSDYANGAYRINVVPPNTIFRDNLNQSFQNDVRIEVDATKSGGPDNNSFGVTCRYQDMDNYYYPHSKSIILKTDKTHAFSLKTYRFFQVWFSPIG